jgi:hypothetical protein
MTIRAIRKMLHTAKHALVLGGVFAITLATGITAFAQSGTFTLTGSLNIARRDHTATLLQNGEVLVAGGTDVDNNFTTALASAELYNPTTGKWTLTGSMSDARTAFTATLLTNGEVLVAGGSNEVDCLDSAELYNPGTGQWTLTGSMNQPRCSHSATLLPNGEVLVAGGTEVDPFQSGTLATAELYNPSTRTWEATGSLNVSRAGSAAVLENGQVLLAAGYNITNQSETILASAELYNPSTGLWTFTASMARGALPTTPVLLTNNNVLIANAAQFYNPATAAWANTGALPKIAGNPTKASLLNTGNALASGTTCNYSGCGHVPNSSCFLYTASTNSWSVTGSMNQARVGHTSTLLPSGKVLVAGGWTRGLDTPIVLLSSAELYTP